MSQPDIRIRPMQITDCAQLTSLAGLEGTRESVTLVEQRLSNLKRRTDTVVFVAVDETSHLWGWVQVAEILPIHDEPRGLVVKLHEEEDARAWDVGHRLLTTAETWSIERGHRLMVVGSKTKRLEILESSPTQEPLPEALRPGVWPSSVIIYTDGASRGNPGPASIGVYVTTPQGEVVDEVAEALGSQTNNVAEYTALLRGLQRAIAQGVREVVVRADSELMIKQMRGEYQVKSEGLKPLFQECRRLARELERVRFEHVRREMNKEADRLANEALDRA